MAPNSKICHGWSRCPTACLAMRCHRMPGYDVSPPNSHAKTVIGDLDDEIGIGLALCGDVDALRLGIQRIVHEVADSVEIVVAQIAQAVEQLARIWSVVEFAFGHGWLLCRSPKFRFEHAKRTGA